MTSPKKTDRTADAKRRAARKAEIAALNAASMNGTLRDELNPLFVFQMTHTDLLVQIATGKLDALQMVREELANRGMGKAGTWVGFDSAETEWGL